MSTKLIVAGSIFGVILILIISLIVASFGRLESHQVGLKYDDIQNILHKEAFREGLHLGPVGFRFIKFEAIFKTISLRNFECLNKDEIEIKLDVTFQYRVRINDLYKIAVMFKDEEGYRKILLPIAEASIHEACSMFTTAEFQTKRTTFQDVMSSILTDRYLQVFTDVTSLQMQDIRRPRQYEKIIQAKEIGREDVHVASQERPTYETIANNNYKKVINEAKITVQEAQSNRKIVLDKANSTAKGILKQYTLEAESFAQLRKALNLSPTEFIKYMATRAIFAEKNYPIDLVVKPPIVN